MGTMITMDRDGKLTVPAATRAKLRIEGETAFDVEVSGDTLVLRIVDAIGEEDAWAYEPEHRERLARARSRPVEEDRRLSVQDFEQLLSSQAE